MENKKMLIGFGVFVFIAVLVGGYLYWKKMEADKLAKAKELPKPAPTGGQPIETIQTQVAIKPNMGLYLEKGNPNTVENRFLQNYLKNQKHYFVDVTGVFDDATENALYEYTGKKGITLAGLLSYKPTTATVSPTSNPKQTIVG